MKNLFFIVFIFTPLTVFSQWDCGFGSGHVCPAPYELDLDRDTVYTFSLKKEYCKKAFFGIPTYFKANLNKEEYNDLRIYHEYSVNCCTQDTYNIRIEKDTIRISTTSEGELCNCGECTFLVKYADYNPSKTNYRFVIENVIDTVVSITSNDNILQKDENFIHYYRLGDQIRVNVNINSTETYHATLFNIEGKTIFQKSFVSSEFFIDIPKSKGFYILEIRNGRKAETLKIIV